MSSLIVRELKSAEYPFWDKLVASSPQRSIFAERWWMEIVTYGGVRLLGCFDDERLIGGLPIWPCRTLGVSRLRQPQLTPYWGPLLAAQEGKYTTRLSSEMSILRAFAEKLNEWPDVTITFHPGLNNWLPFYWSDFTQMTRYTYRIEPLIASLLTERACHESVRSRLRRARKNDLRIDTDIDPLIVAEMARKSMNRQGLDSSSDILHFWPDLVHAAQERGVIAALAVLDPEGNLHAANAIVWDDRCAYGIIGGGDPQYRDSGGGTLAMWHEIGLAARFAPAYDFEGSMLEPIEQFFRRFGGELRPYLLITRSRSLRLNFARAVQQKITTGKQWLYEQRRNGENGGEKTGEGG